MMPASCGWVTGLLLRSLSTAVLLCPLAQAGGSGSEQRPNFIFILSDDQRHDTLGCANNPHIRTPALDKLCARGLRFTNAFVTTSLCSPSRATCLTGRYASGHGVTGLGGRLGTDEQTLAGLLKAAGYRTAVTGKWHVADRPGEVGFEQAVTFESNGRYYGRPVLDCDRRVQVPGHIDQYCADRAVEIMRQWGDQPFFLWFCTQLPHMDHEHRWNATPRSLGKYDPVALPLPSSLRGDLAGKPAYLQTARSRSRAQEEYGYKNPEALGEHIRDYYAVITDMDEIVGNLLDAVDALGIGERTFIIFMGDNGWFLGEHGLTSKVLAYEASIRVPLIVSGPGLKHGTDHHLVLNMDIAPTILELAGIPSPERMHGSSIVPLLRGQPGDWRSSFLYEVPEAALGVARLLALRTERYKYIRTLAAGDPEHAGFEELYDLHQDPDEIRNLFDDPNYGQIRDQLADLMDQHRRQIGQRASSRPAGKGSYQ